MIETAVYTRTSGDATILATVGTRIYPTFMPEGWSAPAIRYHLISDVRDSAMGDDTGLCRARVQFDCVATTYLVAATLRDAVRARWQRFRGTVSSIEIEDAFIENQQSGFDEPSGYHVCTVDVMVHYKE